MNLAIFGATGRTGRHVVDQALAAGHAVKALVRDPARLPIHHERLTLVPGDVLDADNVEQVIVGADAVVSVLGHTATSPKDVLTVATEHILAAMRKHHVRRLVSLTGAGVADPQDRPRLWNKAIAWLLARLQPELLADSERQAALIRRSDLDWVIVRVPRLTDQPRKGSYRVGMVGQGTGALIGRADAADFLMQQTVDTPYLRQAPMISA
jgi:putative NADH-flavin reductase